MVQQASGGWRAATGFCSRLRRRMYLCVVPVREVHSGPGAGSCSWMAPGDAGGIVEQRVVVKGRPALSMDRFLLGRAPDGHSGR